MRNGWKLIILTFLNSTENLNLKTPALIQYSNISTIGSLNHLQHTTEATSSDTFIPVTDYIKVATSSYIILWSKSLNFDDDQAKNANL